jgi:hypothetical protein
MYLCECHCVLAPTTANRMALFNETDQRIMFLVDQRLLAQMWEEKKVTLTVEFREADYRSQKGWEARILTEDGAALLMNARGEARRWRQLNAAISDLQEIRHGSKRPHFCEQ